ncbi:MAG: hypothetical protein PHZ26_05795 [Candidatus Gracilibacteria bacterium]|nr:hypothetical protein [Candidatus Gracilibacteria bacterium]MDD2909225.1 hypothetical protein [Candidatus Gracilibacteria bacterium]
MKINLNKINSIKGISLGFLINNKLDIIKFFVYFSFFFFLFFTFQKVNSPEGESPNLNSASLEIKTNTNNSSVDNYSLGGKIIPAKPSLSIQLKPDNLKIDDQLLKSIKLNIDSKIFKDKVTPLDLTVDSTRIDPRGQVLGSKLILSGKIKDLRESMKVFVHELGHIVDLHYLPNLGDYDPSENFYNISWLSYNVKKNNSKLADFVSGYSLTNKYEDFAESFTFYIFHNDEFKKRTLGNINIARKYNFFSKYIFINNEFQNTGFGNNTILTYNWDTTKIGVNLKKYLYYVK